MFYVLYTIYYLGERGLVVVGLVDVLGAVLDEVLCLCVVLYTVLLYVFVI